MGSRKPDIRAAFATAACLWHIPAAPVALRPPFDPYFCDDKFFAVTNQRKTHPENPGRRKPKKKRKK
jgi:hypothetical protein